MNKRLPSVMPVIKNHLLRTLKIKWDKILEDPRKKEPNWNFGYMIQMLSYGILTACKNLRDVETFSESYNERLPDSTIHDIIIRVNPEPLREFLTKQVKEASHAHELDQKFPIHQTAIDGKSIAVSKIKVGDFSQEKETNGKKYYINRGLRAMQVSGPVKLFLGQREILGKSSEMSEFIPFLDELRKSYKNTNLLDVLSVDAGMTSKENADYISNKNLDYIMALKGPQQTLLENAKYLFGVVDSPSRETKEVANGKEYTRELFRFVVPPAYKHGWDHLKEFWKIKQTTIDLTSGKTITETRYFLSSIMSSKLKDKHVMAAIRMHWGIENNGNWLLDVAWKEDDSPYANRALVLISLMRLIIYNIIARLMYRRLRQAKARQLSWHAIMNLIKAVLFQLSCVEEYQEFIYSPFE